MFDRKLIVKIDYYNWEGNTEESDSWITINLKWKEDSLENVYRLFELEFINKLPDRKPRIS